MEPGKFVPVHIGWIDAFARIGCSILLALAMGAERFIFKKPVDFRPFVIISLASCGLALLIGELPFTSSDENLSIDPLKVISGVMSDIVKGAGSAASIWSAGAIGLICGLGFIWLVAVGVVTLFLLSRRFVDTGPYTTHTEDKIESKTDQT